MSEYTGKFIDGDGLALISQLIDEKLKNLGGGDSYGKYVNGESIVGTAPDGRPLYRYVTSIYPYEISTTAAEYKVLEFPAKTINMVYRNVAYEQPPMTGAYTFNTNFMQPDGSHRMLMCFCKGSNNDVFYLSTDVRTSTYICILEYTKKKDLPDA